MIRPHPTSTLFPYTTLFRSDHQREDRVHDVVVERSSTARLVCPALAGGALDLQERALLRVGLAGVDDEVIGENELGQRVGTVPVRGPIRLAVEAVPEGQIGVPP